jgi:hypothetical protein
MDSPAHRGRESNGDDAGAMPFGNERSGYVRAGDVRATVKGENPGGK